MTAGVEEVCLEAELGPPGLVRWARLRRARTAALTGAAALALVIGGFAVRSAVSTDPAPVPPAEERKQEIEPMRNGRIISGEWGAFDQYTGSFLYAGADEVFGPGTVSSHLGVVRQKEILAEFDCPPSAGCGGDVMGMATFGPGPDEVTAAEGDGGLGLVHVLGFDGTMRDTLDISPAITEDQQLTDLAWSPDGSHLAISTAPRCIGFPCEGNVWIFDRDGGEPQLVFTERAPDLNHRQYENPPVLQELAWSPDGRTLSLLVTSRSPGEAAKSGLWPRLVAVRLPSGQPVRAETLHVYDDVEMPPWNVFGGDFHHYFSSAWSPDGNRIAVTSKGGIAEISAEDGHLLTLNPRKNPGGLLAWLPKP